MTSGPEDFYPLLTRDCLFLRERGFHAEIDPKTVPAIAELAVALTPDAETPVSALETTLRNGIARLEGWLIESLDRPGEKLIEGTEGLFGLIASLGRKQYVRRDFAAKRLLGAGKDNHNLRRKVIGEQSFEKLVASTLAWQLTLMAHENDVSYTGRFAIDRSPPAIIELPSRLPSMRLVVIDPNQQSFTFAQRRALDILGYCIYKELFALCTDGLGVPAPTLMALSDIAPPGDGIEESDTYSHDEYQLRRVLLWAVALITDNDYRRGTTILLGLNDDQRMTLGQRRHRAAPLLGTQNGLILGKSGRDTVFLHESIQILIESAKEAGFTYEVRPDGFPRWTFHRVAF